MFVLPTILVSRIGAPLNTGMKICENIMEFSLDIFTSTVEFILAETGRRTLSVEL